MKTTERTAWYCAAIVILIGPLLFPMTPSFWRVASLFMISLIISAGLHFVTGLAGVVSLCHVALCGVGAYVAGNLAIHCGLSPLVTVPVAFAAAGLVAVILAWITLPLEDHYLTLATLAAGEILGNLFRGLTIVTGGANGLIGVPSLSLFGAQLDAPERYFRACGIVALLILILIRRMDTVILGKALRALGDAGALVESIGVQRNAMRMLAFGVGGALAGLAGALAAHVDGFVGPESFGVNQSVAYLCFMVIGGLGSFRSVIIAAVFAVLATEIFRQFIGWQMVIVAAIVLVVLRLRATDITWNYIHSRAMGFMSARGVR